MHRRLITVFSPQFSVLGRKSVPSVKSVVTKVFLCGLGGLCVRHLDLDLISVFSVSQRLKIFGFVVPLGGFPVTCHLSPVTF